MRFHLPYWAIAHVFGRDPMDGYRLHQGLGRFSLMGQPIQRADRLPKDLVADEKQSWSNGQCCRSAGCRRPLGLATIAGGARRSQERVRGLCSRCASANIPFKFPILLLLEGHTEPSSSASNLHSHSYPNTNSTSSTSMTFFTGSSCKFSPLGRVILSCHVTGGSVGTISIPSGVSLPLTLRCKPPY